MRVNIRADTVEIEGYVNAVERTSKPLMSRIGRFIERICKGAFNKSLERNSDVYCLLNHDRTRVLARTSDNTLELREDNIGLHARAVITDPDVVDKAKRGDLVGWSFGFEDVPGGVEQGIDSDTQLPLRKVRDLDLQEVSILDRRKSPAYDGTLVSVRDDGTEILHGEALIDEMEIRDEIQEDPEPEITEAEPEPEIREEQKEQETKPDDIDYTVYEQMIAEMKGA